jgi:hypothetical protein
MGLRGRQVLSVRESYSAVLGNDTRSEDVSTLPPCNKNPTARC